MKKQRVLLGITSGIAAYKALELIELLQKDGFDVRVILTTKAKSMVDTNKLVSLTKSRVYTDLFENDFDYKKVLEERNVEHINLADWADLMVVIPATANVIGKLAHGISDDYLTTTALALTAPIMLCPAMNVNMWNNPAVLENVTALKRRGAEIVEPVEGMLACGYEGKGRMENVHTVFERIVERLKKTQSMKDKKILVTAGGTIEKIDDVRHIANRSSGRMGTAIADECFLRGANVVLLRAKSSITPRYLMKEEFFETADELEALMKKHMEDTDICFHTAAVSDFYVANMKSGKLPSDEPHDLHLENTHKIINQIKSWNPQVFLVGFRAVYALTDDSMRQKAHEKLQETKADAIVVNDISRPGHGFEADTNEVFVVTANKKKKIPLASKLQIAASIIDFLPV